ncbi:MAG: hypothetical protein WC910_10925 [Bacteroidales bacterium]|jgi:hypothetical protein
MKFEICYNDTKNKDVTFLKQLGATPATIDEYSFYEYAFIISEFDNWLRNEQKYQGVETICVTEVRDKLREFCEDNGILFGEIDK